MAKHLPAILYIGNKLSAHGKTPTAIDWLSAKLEEEGFTVYTSSSKKNKIWRMFDMCLHTVKLRSKISYVLIDTYSTQNFYYAVVVGWLCRQFNIKYIPILRGGDLPDRIKRSRKKANKLFSNAYQNIALSGYLKDVFLAAGYSNTIIIPNIIFLEKYTFKLRKEVSCKLLWVRSFAEIYNTELALSIIESLQNSGINSELCMIGPEKDGSLQRCKLIATKKNLPVTFTGKLSKDAWTKKSENYDIFINTTNFDNTPVSVIEAMALGLPVVTTNVGGIPFIVENEFNGLTVPPNNVNAFITAIHRLVKNPAFAQKIAKNARESVATFDWEIVKQQWLQILK